MDKDIQAVEAAVGDVKNNKSLTKKSKIGSSRGIESLFRSSYLAQLDMITLAATKANIMISLNGLMLSILLIGGASFLSTMPILLIPFAALLLTCTSSIIFAVLAARPLVDKGKHFLDDFRSDRSGLLVFEQYAKLSMDDYIVAMEEMVSDKDRVYRNMISHLHHLGSTAERSYSKLYISYNVFMIGLVVSVILLSIVLAKTMMVVEG